MKKEFLDLSKFYRAFIGTLQNYFRERQRLRDYLQQVSQNLMVEITIVLIVGFFN